MTSHPDSHRPAVWLSEKKAPTIVTNKAHMHTDTYSFVGRLHPVPTWTIAAHMFHEKFYIIWCLFLPYNGRPNNRSKKANINNYRGQVAGSCDSKWTFCCIQAVVGGSGTSAGWDRATALFRKILATQTRTNYITPVTVGHARLSRPVHYLQIAQLFMPNWFVFEPCSCIRPKTIH